MRQRKTARRNRFSLRSSFNLSEHFHVWVTVWVRATGIVGVGQLSLAVEWSHFALLETMKRYQNEGIEPPDGEQCSRRVALQVLGMFLVWVKMWVKAFSAHQETAAEHRR